MKNTLSDLNNYLFEQIERLQDDSLDEQELDQEIQRSNAVQRIAKTIIDNGSLALDAKRYLDQYGDGDAVDLPMLGVRQSEKDGERNIHAKSTHLYGQRKKVS